MSKKTSDHTDNLFPEFSKELNLPENIDRRTFLIRNAVIGAAAAIGGTRELVVLLDHSASMGYGDHWDRAKNAARTAVRSLGAGDKATLVLLSRNAEESMRATADKGRLEGAINAATVDADTSRPEIE